MAVKITSLELENIKRIKAVKLEPASTGLTIVGGKNKQGKTSVLDAILWTLGGSKYQPSNAQNENSIIPPTMKISLNNGIIVERKGKNSSLTVTDPSGKKAGQTLLNNFISSFALNLPEFMEANAKKKAGILLQIIGVGSQLATLEKREKELVNERLLTGRIADQKEKAVKEMVYYPGMPEEQVSAAELIQKQQEIFAINGENQRKRQRKSQLEWQAIAKSKEVDAARDLLRQREEELALIKSDLEIASKDALDLVDQATDQIETEIANIEDINAKIRSNLNRDKAEDEAKQYRSEYNAYTVKIEDVRKERIGLLESADLPLDGLSIAEDELIYKGQKWDCMSGAEQLIVSTAIVRKLNPECGFVLLDKLEQMDMDTLREFGAWLEKEGLQAIATRVSTGDECSIIIEDGYVKGEELPVTQQLKQENKKWEAGVF